MASITAASVSLSSAEVASSNTSTSDCDTALWRAIRCLCPPERRTPPSPITVSALLPTYPQMSLTELHSSASDSLFSLTCSVPPQEDIFPDRRIQQGNGLGNITQLPVRAWRPDRISTPSTSTAPSCGSSRPKDVRQCGFALSGHPSIWNHKEGNRTGGRGGHPIGLRLEQSWVIFPVHFLLDASIRGKYPALGWNRSRSMKKAVRSAGGSSVKICGYVGRRAGYGDRKAACVFRKDRDAGSASPEPLYLKIRKYWCWTKPPPRWTTIRRRLL